MENLQPQIAQVTNMPTGHLRSLLLILVFTFIASGITLVVFYQVQNYGSDQDYLAMEASLPTHRPNSDMFTDKTKPDTSDWKTYRNEEYGFELKFPPRWAALKVDESNNIDFMLPRSANPKEYQSVCYINVYSKDYWDSVQDNEEPHPGPDYIVIKDGGVYFWSCEQDSDEGFVGFEDYTQTIDPANYIAASGPYREFKDLVIPTFKFTK